MSFGPWQPGVVTQGFDTFGTTVVEVGNSDDRDPAVYGDVEYLSTGQRLQGAATWPDPATGNTLTINRLAGVQHATLAQLQIATMEVSWPGRLNINPPYDDPQAIGVEYQTNDGASPATATVTCRFYWRYFTSHTGGDSENYYLYVTAGAGFAAYPPAQAFNFQTRDQIETAIAFTAGWTHAATMTASVPPGSTGMTAYSYVELEVPFSLGHVDSFATLTGQVGHYSLFNALVVPERMMIGGNLPADDAVRLLEFGPSDWRATFRQPSYRFIYPDAQPFNLDGDLTDGRVRFSDVRR